MTVAEFNRLNERLLEIVADYVADLKGVYEQAFYEVSEDAVSAFVSETVTAAGWVPPLMNALPTSLPSGYEDRANEIRDEAALTMTEVFAALGLSVVGGSLLLAVSQRGVANFEAQMLRVLRTTVVQAMDEGLSVGETAAKIREKFSHLSPSTAEMMAQTELTTIANERSLTAAQIAFSDSEKPVYKTWMTVGDNKVRAAHAQARGQTVPIDQPFQVGGSSMMYPGDPSAPLRLVARCRCHMTYTETLVASAQEVTLMPVKTESSTNSQSTVQVSSTTPVDELTAGIVVTITEEPEEEETPEEDSAEGGVEEEEMSWKALLAIEGKQTEDGRLLEKGSLTWRELPLSLMAMDETSAMGGHDGAKVAGRIDKIWRDGNEIWGSGVFSNTEFGRKVCALVSEQSLRGNSVDLAVLAYEYRNAETGEPLSDDEMMDAFFGEVPILFAVTEGVIMASTVCPTPAIEGAEIMLASGVMCATFTFIGDPDEVLTAGAAGMAPLHPPREWFSDPLLRGPTPLTVTPEGRVYGHAALFDTCHIGEPAGPGICVPPPRSGMNYSVFHHGVVTTAEGEDVPCGQITLGTKHAGRDLSWRETIAHYEDSGMAVADVAAGEDRFGIWVSGGLRPNVPAEKVREMKAGALSGDWRQVIGKGLEFLAALVVNVPGFPIPRPEARVVASAAGEEEVLALVAAGIVPVADEVEGMSRREYLRKIAVLTRDAR